MKYVKILFVFILLVCCFSITQNVYCTEEAEDLTLSRIYVEPGSLEPEFSETRDYYTLLLNPDVTSLLVQATPTNTELRYEIKGNENLKEGENIITITVFSKDNTKSKVYTINALKTDDPDKYNALLSTLIIDNYPFNEDFFPEKFNYTTKSNTTNNNVEVFAYPQNSNATVEIKGNENLKDGENLITITVTSENGLAKREYTIKIYKGNLAESNATSISSSNTDLIDINNNSNANSEFKTFIITSIIIVIILLSIIFISKRK